MHERWLRLQNKKFANYNLFFWFRFVEGVCPNAECGYEDARGDQVRTGLTKYSQRP